MRWVLAVLVGSVGLTSLVYFSRPTKIKEGLTQADVHSIRLAVSRQRWISIQRAMARREFRVYDNGPYLIEIAFAPIREIGPISGFKSQGQPIRGAYALMGGPFSRSTAIFFLGEKETGWKTGEPESQYRLRR